MSAAPLPADEAERLRALRRYGILDTEAEPAFDRLTRLACRLFDLPIALVSLIDSERQWFKSHQGLEACETHRDLAFCAHAILTPADLLEVLDPEGDPRFADNALVTGPPHIRYYAGVPLVTPDGRALGTFCLIDTKARPPLDADGRESLRTLARATVSELELRLERLDRRLTAEAAAAMGPLSDARIGDLAHELKTPLTTILGYSRLARETASGAKGTDLLDRALDSIHGAGEHMLALVEALLAPLRREPAAGGPALRPVPVASLLKGVAGLVGPVVSTQGMMLRFGGLDDRHVVQADPLRLRQILVNFITNAVKYAASGTITLDVSSATTSDRLRITVRDEGPGLTPDDAARVFEEGFRVATTANRIDGLGKGLALSRLAAETMGGRVGVDSVPGAGAAFWIELPRADGVWLRSDAAAPAGP